MSIVLRGKSYQATVNHKGARFRRDFATMQEAELWKAEAKVLLLQGKTPVLSTAAKAKAGVPNTLKELIDHVYETHWSAQSAGDKARTNALALASILGVHKSPDKVTKLDLDKAKKALLDSGNSPATVNRKLAAFSKAMSVALDLELIVRKPKVEKYPETESRQRRFTADDEKMAVEFFTLIGRQDMADYVVLSLDTGLRQGECMTLTFDAVMADTIQISGDDAKSGKNRTVPLTKRVQAMIERRKAEAPDAKGRVLWSLSTRAVHHNWNRLKESAELSTDDQFTPHIMRHEFLSRLADKGLNAAILQRLAGHASLSTTQRYIHVSGRELVNAIKHLEAA